MCCFMFFANGLYVFIRMRFEFPVRGGLFRSAPQRDIAPDSPDCGPAANLTLGIVFEDAQAPAGGGG